MAKDLPYFKFFCSEWNDGDITLEDYETQGLFINICSYYWSNGCDVKISKLRKKFKEDDLIESLINEGLLKIEDGLVVISFLIEQLGERDSLSNQNSINAKKRWDAIRELKRLENESNAFASSSHCETSTESMQYREEEIREEKDNILDFEKFTSWFNVRRTQYLEIPSNIKRLTHSEKITLGLLKKDYSKDDFELAMYNLCNDDWSNKNNQVLCSYFLQTKIFNKFLSMEKKPMLTKRQRTIRGGLG